MERTQAIRRQENGQIDDAPVSPIPLAHLVDRSPVPCYYFRADYSLVQDKAFKKHVQAYAADEGLFFKE